LAVRYNYYISIASRTAAATAMTSRIVSVITTTAASAASAH
jgi:hypothetical protein